MEYYNYIKSLHLIFVVTWFAGLFYEPRLFIYHIEASKKAPLRKKSRETTQNHVAQIVYIVSLAPVLATIFAIWLLVLMPEWLYQPRMLIKTDLFYYSLPTT